ncbi:MAG: BTAD domain-containing putative transcriptional regulator [Actinomycetota bacterium]
MQFGLLGPLEVLANGRAKPLGTRKERLLLALLLTDRSVVSLDRIVDALWEADPPGKPATSIRSYVSNIRRTLGEHVDDPRTLVVSEDSGYSLNLSNQTHAGQTVDISVDVDRFENLVDRAGDEVDPTVVAEQLDQALLLVRGEPLADMAYAEFAQPEIRRLTELVLSTEERRFEVGLQLGQAARILPRVSALVEAHPLRDALRQAHMAALALTGRSAEALRSYQEHRSRLVDEMGIEPGPTIRELEARILAEDGPFAQPAGLQATASVPTNLAPEPEVVAAPGPGTDRNRASDRIDPAHVERRQLTILTAVGVSNTGARSDPEDLRLAAQQQGPIWQEVITRLGGRVHRLDGGEMIAYFGYPAANEDDAERAVRAGLYIAERTDGGAKLGIATGTVIVEPHADAAETGTVDLVGEAVSVARSLCDRAAAGEVLTTAETRSVTRHRFRFDETDGGAARVVAVRRTAGRLPPPDGDGLSPLVGRSEELALLRRRFDLASEGDGQVVFLSGEAGVGKSRIIAELLSNLQGTDADLSVLQFSCSPLHTSSALQPIVDHVLDLAGCEELDRADVLREKLSTLADRSPIGSALRLLGSLAENEEDASLVERVPDPQERHERLLDAAVEVIDAARSDGRSTGPLVCVVEDTHWIDASTRSLLDRLIDRSASQQLLLIVTHRRGAWSEAETTANCTTLRLSPIARSECLSIARHLAGEHILPAAVETEIVRKSDGIPLFVEEITKAVVEQYHARDERVAALPPDPTAAHRFPVPMTLHDSLMARLDRSPDGRSLAQVAAAIGHSVNRSLLAAVGSASLDQVDQELDSLVSAGILVRRGESSTATYRFRHALIRDTAYQSLLREERWSLHARIASVLENEWSDRSIVDPVLLAQQWQAATKSERAVHWWQIAARRATETRALHEALDCVTLGLALTDRDGDASDWTAARIELLLLRGVAESQLLGPGSDAAGTTYREILAYGPDVLAGEQYYSALWGCWYHDTINDQRQSRSDHADRLYDLATTMGDEPLLIEAHHVQWSSLVLDGDFAASRWHTQQVDEIYDHGRHHHLTYSYGGHDPGVCMHGIGALTEWLLGSPEEAIEHVGLATSLTDHGYSVLEGAFGPLVIALLNRDLDAVMSLTATLEELVAEGSIPPEAMGFAKGYQGAVRAECGDLDGGAKLMTDAAGDWRRLWGAYCYPLDAVYADTMSRLGDHDAGRSLIDELLGQDSAHHSPWWDAEFHRIRAHILARSDTGSLRCLDGFDRAAEIADGQGAVPLRVRALRDRIDHTGRLGADVGDRAAQLRALVLSYPDDTDVLDVITARELLAHH